MLENNKVFSKVFLWMFIGLAITFGVGYYVSLNENMLYNVFAEYYIFIVIASLLVGVFLSVRINKMQPMTSKIMFCVYSFLIGLTFSSIFVVFKITSIVYIFAITSLLFLIFALIGHFTKINLTKIGVYLLMGLLGIIICMIINMFVGSEKFDVLITSISLIIFLAYVAYDIQVIKRKLQLVENEETVAVYGAFMLYLDFINIFLDLLRLFGKNNN